MYNKLITTILSLSLITSIGLAAQDPQYIPLATAVVGGGVTVISEIIKKDTKQLPSAKDNKSERGSLPESKEDSQE